MNVLHLLYNVRYFPFFYITFICYQEIILVGYGCTIYLYIYLDICHFYSQTRNRLKLLFRNVSNSTLEKGNVSGLWKLTVLTSCLQIFPMIFLWLLPNNAADQVPPTPTPLPHTCIHVTLTFPIFL